MLQQSGLSVGNRASITCSNQIFAPEQQKQHRLRFRIVVDHSFSGDVRVAVFSMVIHFQVDTFNGNAGQF